MLPPELPQSSQGSRSSLHGLRFAKPNELEERTFEPVCEGWLVVTKLGKESPCGDFDSTE